MRNALLSKLALRVPSQWSWAMSIFSQFPSPSFGNPLTSNRQPTQPNIRNIFALFTSILIQAPPSTSGNYFRFPISCSTWGATTLSSTRAEEAISRCTLWHTEDHRCEMLCQRTTVQYVQCRIRTRRFWVKYLIQYLIVSNSPQMFTIQLFMTKETVASRVLNGLIIEWLDWLFCKHSQGFGVLLYNCRANGKKSNKLNTGGHTCHTCHTCHTYHTCHTCHIYLSPIPSASSLLSSS